MPSKFLVPLEVPDFQGTPSSTADAGYVLLYIKYGWLTSKLSDGSQVDLVLQRPLDGFTQSVTAEPVTAADTVLRAIEKIQKTLSNIRLTGDVTGTGAYSAGELIINTTGGGIDCTALISCSVIVDLDGRITALENTPQALAATEFDGYHYSGYGTQYTVGDLVYYSGHVFRANFNNDGVTPAIGGNTYWTDLGSGNRMRQILSDWNATTGEAQILNKPTSLSQFTNDAGFITSYTEVDTLDSVIQRGNASDGGMKVNGGIDLNYAAGTTDVLRIGHQNTAVAFVDIRPSYAGPNIGLYVQNPTVTGTSYAFIAQAQTSNAATDNIAGYFNAQYGNTNTAIRTDYGNNLLNALGGNLLVGTTVDAGFKLDVNGWFRVFQPLSGGSIEFYPEGSGGGTYTAFTAKSGSNAGPLIELYGDNSGTAVGYGIYGPDPTYDGLLIYKIGSSIFDAVFISSSKISLPKTQQLIWSSSSTAIDTPLAGIAYNNAASGFEINDGTLGSYANLILYRLTATSLAGTGTRMVVADSTGFLSTQAIPSGSTGTVTSVSALTIGTTGTDITSTVANSTTTPVITLNIPTASAANRGALSSTDWTTFNSKFTLPSLTSGSVLFSNGTTIAQDNTNFFWDNTNKRLGIGTATPAYQLSLAGSANIQGVGGLNLLIGTRGILFGLTSSTEISTYLATSPLIFSLNQGSTPVARFAATTGNFLIGTTTDSGFKLDINGTSMFRDVMTFRAITAMDSAPLGSELATTASGTNWTGTSFATGYTHTTGSVVALTSALAPTNGNFYQIAATITGRTAGSITIAIGGVSLAGITATGAWGIKATSTAVLTVTPTTDFDGVVVLSVKLISNSTAIMSWQSSSGTVVNELRVASATNNLFFGTGAGQKNTTGTSNVALGHLAGQSETTGTANVFVGFNAGLNSTTGNQNVYVGAYAGQTSVSTTQNTFMGYFTGSSATGSNNSFYGAYAGQSTTGNSNSFFGWQSGQNNTSGQLNVAMGFQAMFANLTGSSNVVIGNQAGRYISGGATAATILNNSIIIGSNAYPLADNQTNQIVIGYNVVGLGSNTTVLGNSSTTFAAIYGNVGIGTTTDAGYKLDVNGTARVTGAMTFANSSSINASGNLSIGAFSIHSSFGFATFSNNVTLLLTGGTFNSTSGTQIGSSFTGTFNPTSGTATYAAYSIVPTINQTGGANGITRGLYINPTLTAAADFRAIEVASGITVLGASTTAKASLRIPSGTAPTTPVNGDIWFDGTNIKMQIGGVTKTFTLT